MLSRLAVPFVDARASALSWWLGDDAPPNFILMNLVGMSDPGLLILPTHRLVSGLTGLTASQSLR